MLNSKPILLLMLMSISAVVFAQTVIEDSVSLGAGYADQVYYSFDDGEVLTSSGTDWDIAFRAGTFTSSIRINGGQGVRLYQLAGDTSAFSSTTDTVGLSGFNVLYNADTTWEYGAFERNPAGSFNYGWGEYNQTTHIVTGTRAFILEAMDGSFKKIVIEALESGTWKFRYADIDGSNQVSDSVVVNNFNDKIYIGYSLVDQQVVDFEPNITAWDMVFQKFVTEDYNGAPYEEVTGILTNLNIAVAEARNIAYDDADYTNYTLTADNIMTIGWDWKGLDFTAPTPWVVEDSLSYFIQAQSGKIYQFWMTNWAGSSTGNAYFSFREVGGNVGINEAGETVTAFGTYPNPSNGQFNVVYTAHEQINNLSFEIYNLAGQRVYSVQLPVNAGINTHSVNISDLNLPNGMYQSILRGDEVIARDKMIITR